MADREVLRLRHAEGGRDRDRLQPRDPGHVHRRTALGRAADREHRLRPALRARYALVRHRLPPDVRTPRLLSLRPVQGPVGLPGVRHHECRPQLHPAVPGEHFVGGDRIANANQISIGATSRLIRPSDGQEQVRAVIGQRYYFTDAEGDDPRPAGANRRHFAAHPRARGPHRAELDRRASALSTSSAPRAASVRPSPRVRYSPAPSSVASIAYRYTNQDLTAGAGTIENIDVAAQWPLGGGVYGVARYSYDVVGRQTVEALVGRRI